MNNENQTYTEISKLTPFHNHPFENYTGKRFDDLVESIGQFGILEPVIVRQSGELLEILSGHNRVNAAKKLGFEKIPVVIKEGLTEEQALLVVTETNLIQRSFADLKHSERAIVIKNHVEALKSARESSKILEQISTDLVDNKAEYKARVHSEHKGRSSEQTADKYGLSSATVQRYLRLALLNKDLLEKVNGGEIKVVPAVALSFLSESEQECLAVLLFEDEYEVDKSKAESLKLWSQRKNGKLPFEKIEAILKGRTNAKTKVAKPIVKVSPKVYAEYFDDDAKEEDVVNTIKEALRAYFESKK